MFQPTQFFFVLPIPHTEKKRKKEAKRLNETVFVSLSCSVNDVKYCFLLNLLITISHNKNKLTL